MRDPFFDAVQDSTEIRRMMREWQRLATERRRRRRRWEKTGEDQWRKKKGGEEEFRKRRTRPTTTTTRRRTNRPRYLQPLTLQSLEGFVHVLGAQPWDTPGVLSWTRRHYRVVVFSRRRAQFGCDVALKVGKVHQPLFTCQGAGLVAVGHMGNVRREERGSESAT